MLPFLDPQNNSDKSFHDQLELPVPDSSYFPFTPTIFCLDSASHDLLLLPSNSSSDVIMSAVPAAEAQHQHPDPAASAPVFVAAAGMGDGSCGGRRIRSTRKDRHSKIFTATGPRDRRMRLSIDVARRFFQLQDMLGFDKASKTVQWLLTMSKAAINDLAAASCGTQSPKSTESSTLSGSKNKKSKLKSKSAKSSTVTDDGDHQERKTNKSKRGAAKPSRKIKLIHSELARESRAKARERARERTKEKRRNITASLFSSVALDAIKEESISLQNLQSVYHDFSDDRERKSCLNMAAGVASERAYEYPDTLAGSGLLQVPGSGNYSQLGGVAAAVAAAAAAAAISVDAAGSIFQEEYWADMDSFYSR